MDYFKCRHCLKLGHWAENCPFLQTPESRTDHEARLNEIKRRFIELEIGPLAKQRMIKKENELWKKRQKELAK